MLLCSRLAEEGYGIFCRNIIEKRSGINLLGRERRNEQTIQLGTRDDISPSVDVVSKITDALEVSVDYQLDKTSMELRVFQEVCQFEVN